VKLFFLKFFGYQRSAANLVVHKPKLKFIKKYIGTWMSAETASGSKIIAMALNSSETILIALTDTHQLMSYTLKGHKGKSEFQVFCHPFHNGAITGVDICHRKPLIATCGADRSIKIWNYLTLELELSKEFEESIESIALHPTGE
jgi:WD40 repeat protein